MGPTCWWPFPAPSHSGPHFPEESAEAGRGEPVQPHGLGEAEGGWCEFRLSPRAGCVAAGGGLPSLGPHGPWGDLGPGLCPQRGHAGWSWSSEPQGGGGGAWQGGELLCPHLQSCLLRPLPHPVPTEPLLPSRARQGNPESGPWEEVLLLPYTHLGHLLRAGV